MVNGSFIARFNMNDFGYEYKLVQHIETLVKSTQTKKQRRHSRNNSFGYYDNIIPAMATQPGSQQGQSTKGK